MSFNLSQGGYSTGGITQIPIAFTSDRDPTANDINFAIGQRWLNQLTKNEWVLFDFSSSTGTVQALWEEIGGQHDVNTLTGDTGGAVSPNSSGNIDLLGTANQITTTGNPGTNTITFSLTNGVSVASFNVDANTPPGTDPVLPTAAGQVTVTGGQVAAATTANVIRTASLAANTYTIQVQRSTTAAVSTVGSNGVCHFNSAQFTVDANGFVSTTTGGFTWNNIGASQALVAGNGYFCSSGGALSLSLPIASSVGDTIQVVLNGSTSWTITQGGGQQIRFGNQTTTLGGGGSLASNQQGDSVEIVCMTANTIWCVVDSIGGLTVT